MERSLKTKIDSFEIWKESRKFKESKENVSKKGLNTSKKYETIKLNQSFSKKDEFKRQISETRKQMLESLKKLEDNFDNFIPEHENIPVNISNNDEKVISRNRDDNLSELYRRIAELESLVKKLSIERDMWKFKAEHSIDPKLSLSTTILNLNDDELNESIIKQHENLDKINFN